MTVTENITALVVRKHHGWYTIDGSDSVRLQARGGMRRGVLRTATESWPIFATNFWRTAVAVGSGETPLIRLEPDRAYAPGGPVEWSTSREQRQQCHQRGARRSPRR